MISKHYSIQNSIIESIKVCKTIVNKQYTRKFKNLCKKSKNESLFSCFFNIILFSKFRNHSLNFTFQFTIEMHWCIILNHLQMIQSLVCLNFRFFPKKKYFFHFSCSSFRIKCMCIRKFFHHQFFFGVWNLIELKGNVAREFELKKEKEYFVHSSIKSAI